MKNCVDIEVLKRRTKVNPLLMMEMITLYLQQTPSLIQSLKKGLKDNDMQTMQATAHKMIPSFSIMGIQGDGEIMSKKLVQYDAQLMAFDELEYLVLQLEMLCTQACEELEREYDTIKYGKL